MTEENDTKNLNPLPIQVPIQEPHGAHGDYPHGRRPGSLTSSQGFAFAVSLLTLAGLLLLFYLTPDQPGRSQNPQNAELVPATGVSRAGMRVKVVRTVGETLEAIQAEYRVSAHLPTYAEDGDLAGSISLWALKYDDARRLFVGVDASGVPHLIAHDDFRGLLDQGGYSVVEYPFR